MRIDITYRDRRALVEPHLARPESGKSSRLLAEWIENRPDLRLDHVFQSRV